MRYLTTKSRIVLILILLVAVALAAVFGVGISKTLRGTHNLSAQIERYNEKIEEESERRTELEEEEKYVKTKEFIAEKARSVGYVLPGEIIFTTED